MANEAENKYITVAYKLYVPMSGNDHELVEEATPEHPFQIISGMGLALDAFEAQIVPLAKGDTFDFTLSIDEAYGPFAALEFAIFGGGNLKDCIAAPAALCERTRKHHAVAGRDGRAVRIEA